MALALASPGVGNNRSDNNTVISHKHIYTYNKCYDHDDKVLKDGIVQEESCWMSQKEGEHICCDEHLIVASGNRVKKLEIRSYYTN